MTAFDEIGGAGGVPCGITASFKGLTDAACWKARTIGFALDELCAAKLCHGAALVVVGQEAVVFFGALPRQRVKDVCVMRCASFHCPAFHRSSDRVGGRSIQLFAAFDGALQGAEDRLWKVLLHLIATKHIGVEKLFGGEFLGGLGEAAGLVVDPCNGFQSCLVSAHLLFVPS